MNIVSFFSSAFSKTSFETILKLSQSLILKKRFATLNKLALEEESLGCF